MNVFIIDDDREFSAIVKQIIAKYDREYSKSARVRTTCFTNAVDAINATSEVMPDLIFLDVLLNGPDGFTFLNEMQSYEDLAKVPVVIMSSLRFDSGMELKSYGVVGILNKSEMTPTEIWKYVEKYMVDVEKTGGNKGENGAR